MWLDKVERRRRILFLKLEDCSLSTKNQEILHKPSYNSRHLDSYTPWYLRAAVASRTGGEIDLLPFLALNPRGLNSLSPGKKLNIPEHFSLFCSILSGQVVLVIRNKAQRVFNLLCFVPKLSSIIVHLPSFSYHCGSLNIGIHQLRGSHWESPIYSFTALCTGEGLKFYVLPQSVKWTFLSKSLW